MPPAGVEHRELSIRELAIFGELFFNFCGIFFPLALSGHEDAVPSVYTKVTKRLDPEPSATLPRSPGSVCVHVCESVSGGMLQGMGLD